MTSANDAEETPAPRRDNDLVRAVAPAFISFGVAFRIWMLTTPVGGLDSDEAITGFMARHILAGEFPMFYWGQQHGGPHEPLLAAAVFWVFGSSTLALKLVSAFLSAVACVLVWRVGKRTVGEAAAAVAGLLFWIWPAAFVWWSVKSRGFYHVGIVAGLAMVLLTLRLQRRDSALDMAGLGALVGAGLWISPQTIFFSVPALLWLVVKKPSVLRMAPLGVAAAIAGAFPWLVYNVENGWAALRAQPVAFELSAYLDSVRVFVVDGLPPALGLEYPDGSSWIGSGFGRVAFVVLLALFLVALVRMKGPARLLTLACLTYPLLYALSIRAGSIQHPRYLYFLGPFVALIVARGLASLRAYGVVAGLLAALVLTTVAGTFMRTDHDFVQTAEGVAIPRDFDPLFDYLEERGIEHVYAHYWLSYVVGFESAEELAVTTYSGGVRHFAADAEVRAATEVAYVFISGSPSDPAFRDALVAQGIGYERAQAGQWVIYTPDTNVHPERFPALHVP